MLSSRRKRSELGWDSARAEDLAVRSPYLHVPPPTPILTHLLTHFSVSQITVFNNLLIQDVILSLLPHEDIRPRLFLTSRNFAMRLVPMFYLSLRMWPRRLAKFINAGRQHPSIFLNLKHTRSLSISIESTLESVTDLGWLVKTLQARSLKLDSVTTLGFNFRWVDGGGVQRNALCDEGVAPLVALCPKLLTLRLTGDIPEDFTLEIAQVINEHHHEYRDGQLHQVTVDVPALSLFSQPTPTPNGPYFKAVRTLDSPLVGNRDQYRQFVEDFAAFVIACLRTNTRPYFETFHVRQGLFYLLDQDNRLAVEWWFLQSMLADRQKRIGAVFVFPEGASIKSFVPADCSELEEGGWERWVEAKVGGKELMEIERREKAGT